MTPEKDFNQKFLAILGKYIPKKTDQLALLTEVLSIGREAAYRRLKGDVSFTFSEACLVAKQVGISLDFIANNQRETESEFNLLINAPSLSSYNYEKLYEHSNLFQRIFKDSECKIQLVCNMIPYSFFFPFEGLSKVRLFKWKYQLENHIHKVKFADVVLPQDIIKLQRSLGRKLHFMPENIFIFERGIFSSFIEELKYFYNLELITRAEKDMLKEELFEMVAAFERLAIEGRNRAGNRSLMFLSNIDFDCNYVYVESEKKNYSYIEGIYLMDAMVSSDPAICKIHKDWIDSLRKYSTMISVSGEIERRVFFREQEEIINSF